MSIHISFNEDDPSVERLLHRLPAGDVRSTTFTLTPSGNRMPGNFLTVWLAHPRGLPCRRRRVLRVVDRTNEQHDDHDSPLLASESYNELRELHWSSYRFCLPFLLDFLFLTPRLQTLHVHALRDLLGTLDEIRPERPSWPLLDRPYTFSLTSFECSAVLTGDIIEHVIACSALTLRDLYLLIHASEFNILAPELSELPTLRNLTLLSADETFRQSLLQRFLHHCPRLTALTIAIENLDDPRELQFHAYRASSVNTLTLYCARQTWSLRAARNLHDAFQQLTNLRTLKVVALGFDSDDARAALQRVCAGARVMLRVTVFRPPTPAWLDLRGIVPVSYAGMPRV